MRTVVLASKCSLAASSSSELEAEHVHDVVLLVGLEDVVLEVGEGAAYLWVHDLVLEERVRRQLFDDLPHDGLLAAYAAGPLEVAEEPLDLGVVLLEQDDRVTGHGGLLGSVW